jgi:methylmalonyl-CoA mutase cobalamin-binding subunit
MAYEAAGEPSPERPLLVGLGPGSQHELGAFAFAIAARRAGLPVLYLGPNLPAESWITAAETRSARGAVIGAPTAADVRRAREVMDALRAARPEMLLAIGGEEAARVVRDGDAVVLPRDAVSDAVAAVRAALDARPAETTRGLTPGR